MTVSTINRLFFGALLVLAACATVQTKIPIAYELLDVPEKQRVELAYRNTSRRELCLSASDWPNRSGALNQASNRVALIIDGQRFPVKDVNTGYCVGGCPTRVAPGKTVTGFLRYSDFNLPAELMSRPKSLDFSPRAYPCSQSTM